MNKFRNKKIGSATTYFYLTNDGYKDEEESIFQNGYLKTIRQELIELVGSENMDSLLFLQREGSVREIMMYLNPEHTLAETVAYIRASWDDEDEELLDSPSITIPLWAT